MAALQPVVGNVKEEVDEARSTTALAEFATGPEVGGAPPPAMLPKTKEEPCEEVLEQDAVLFEDSSSSHSESDHLA